MPLRAFRLKDLDHEDYGEFVNGDTYNTTDRFLMQTNSNKIKKKMIKTKNKFYI